MTKTVTFTFSGHSVSHPSPPRPHASIYDSEACREYQIRRHHTTAGIAQLVGHGPHGWARLCGTRDSLLMTHGLLLKIGLHGGRYDPQPVTRSSEWVSEWVWLKETLPLRSREISDLNYLPVRRVRDCGYLQVQAVCLSCSFLRAGNQHSH